MATVPVHNRRGDIDVVSTRRAAAMIHAGVDDPLLYHDDLATGAQVYALREGQLLTHMAAGTKVVSGHVLFSETAERFFGETYAFVTVMREPVARVLSNFGHSAAEGLFPRDFDAYLSHYCARSQGLMMLRFFAGRHEIAPGEEAEALAIAKARVDRFDVIGFLDDLDGFCSAYRNALGVRPRVFRYNERRWPKATPTPEQRARLETLMAPEIALWEYAQKRRR